MVDTVIRRQPPADRMHADGEASPRAARRILWY
jgi:hypothetical protein